MGTFDVFNRIIEQEKSAAQFGFYWENLDQLLDQIKSECKEVKEAYLKLDSHQNTIAHLKEEVGDLINATISLCIFLNFDPESTLNESVEKFQKRYDALVNFAHQDGLTHLKNQSFETLMAYWDKAKQASNAE